MKWVHALGIGMMLLSWSAGPLPARGEAAAPEKEIRDLVQRFFSAYIRKDLDGFMALWSAKSPDHASRKRTMQRIFAETGPIEVKNLEILGVSVNQQTAEARFRVELIGQDTRTGKPHRLLGKLSRRLQFVREDGRWKVWRYLSPEQELAERLAAASANERKNLMAQAQGMDKSLLASQILDQVFPLLGHKRTPDAVQLTELAFPLAVEAGEKEVVARAWVARSEVLRAQAKYPEALEAARQAQTIAHEAHLPVWEVNALYDMAIIQKKTGKSKEAMESLKAGVQLARPLDSKGLLARGLFNLGLLQSRERDPSLLAEAAAHLEEAAKLAHEIRARDLEKRAVYNLGWTRGKQKQYDDAVKYLTTSADLARQDGDRSWEATARADVALAYEGLKDYSQAIEADEAALKLFEGLQNKHGQARVLKHLGWLYRQVGRYADAAEAVESSEKLQRELDSEGARPKR